MPARPLAAECCAPPRKQFFRNAEADSRIKSVYVAGAYSDFCSRGRVEGIAQKPSDCGQLWACKTIISQRSSCGSEGSSFGAGYALTAPCGRSIACCASEPSTAYSTRGILLETLANWLANKYGQKWYKYAVFRGFRGL